MAIRYADRRRGTAALRRARGRVRADQRCARCRRRVRSRPSAGAVRRLRTGLWRAGALRTGKHPAGLVRCGTGLRGTTDARPGAGCAARQVLRRADVARLAAAAVGARHPRRQRRAACRSTPRRPPNRDRAAGRRWHRAGHRHADGAVAGASIMKADFAIVGLGRIGGNLARQALEGGLTVAGYSRGGVPKDLQAAGLQTIQRLTELRQQLAPPRIVFVYIPAGQAVDELLDELASLLEPDDVVVDGGNSYWGDSMRRADSLRRKRIDLVDVGTSGGV
ncbi:MAG TPA: NAD(P)-binding domain-containing protein, partial [Burkholderiaceae bacterium]|nr:NAD(P)-binding domain-containing protein [Burkholderiaceae bacterium]